MGGGAVNTGNRAEGPLTGENYTQWSDRLRDVEEVLQNPELRNQVAQILDRARGIRTDFKKRGQDPRWDMVDLDVLKPMRVVQNRVAEELARYGQREAVVPVDRDPVPQKYTDLVSRYYERLGKD
jgi:hypothetical protein